MRLHFIICISIAVMTLTCASRKNVADGSSIDVQEARAFSDALVDDIIHDRRENISAKIDPSFQKAGPQYLNSSIDYMFNQYGQPLECSYKMNAVGNRTDSEGKKPMRKFWYSARTTKYPSGYYLFVEVVPGDGGLRTTGFALVTFPNGAPSNLQ
jgi:hypothetical protein